MASPPDGPVVTIGDRTLDAGQPPLLVAELSANHRQDLSEAENLIQAAAEAGADAIKLQHYTPDSLTLPLETPPFQIKTGPWAGRTLYELYAEAAMPYTWTRPLANLCEKLGLLCFSTPFDTAAVDFLETELRPPAYKVASFEINHIPLLRKIAVTGKPVIVSTGMASYPEIEYAVETLQKANAGPIVLLHCISAYPASPASGNVRRMAALRDSFKVPTGLSDHTLSNETALAATALGAVVIEKHLCLSRSSGGVDAGFSLEPSEFAEMVRAVRGIQTTLGDGSFNPQEAEEPERTFRRSIFVANAVSEGELLTTGNLRIVRPGDGLSPRQWDHALGKRATRSLTAGEPLQNGDFA